MTCGSAVVTTVWSSAASSMPSMSPAINGTSRAPPTLSRMVAGGAISSEPSVAKSICHDALSSLLASKLFEIAAHGDGGQRLHTLSKRGEVIGMHSREPALVAIGFPLP
jgi:hypothetical protein